ncbi:uncharacterized protein LOC130827847 [Amaranthus tricolor]|uniref:uncharacterized protein LOC130827847 n=1 Tax=Amaranthus tricolor TaxID=29722 RepID=UPI0025881AC0|nr:uncharacterized protein LOC130827847 [Amaranthus tricolor]
MGVNVVFTIVVMLLVYADDSNAAFLGNFRKLAASPPKEHDSPPDVSPSSPSLPKKKSSPIGKENENKPTPASTGEDGSKDKQAINSKNLTPPPVEEHDNTQTDDLTKKGKESEEKEEEKEKKNEKTEEKQEQKEEENEKAEEKEEQKEEQKENQKEKDASKTSDTVGGESCDKMQIRCQDLKSMTACIESFGQDSKALVLLIQNKGDSDLKADITLSPSASRPNGVNVPKRQSTRVNMPLAGGGINEISLSSGNGQCVLHISAPASQWDFFRHVPSYSKFMTPIYGAYMILVITFIAGGVWACCWFKKKKGQHDIPYQELEMSMPESAAAAAATESAEGWNDVWDDDWDEEKAVKSPGGHSISANGLTSRNPKKDDWEDWDD